MLPAIYLFLSLLPLTITARSVPLQTNQTLEQAAKPANPAVALPVNIPGTAGSRTFCGSRGMAKCATGNSCIADPANLATSLIGDGPGFCVKADGQSCGGDNGDSCPADQTCVDKPNDGCNPQTGGTNCAKICVFLDGRSAAAA